MKIKNKGVLRSLEISILRKQIIACKKLKKSYEKQIGLAKCPLCPAANDECNDCPWKYIKGMYCHDWTTKDITCVRSYPKGYTRQANLRVIALTEWINIINAEITRRSKNGKKRITKTGKKS